MNQESRIKNWKIILLISFLIFSFFSVYSPVLAQDPAYEPGYLIVCDMDCDFEDLMKLVVNLINFLIVLSTVLATAAFAWVGIILITSGGNPGKKDDAKKIFSKVVWGYLWILFAWLLVYTISTALLNEGFFFLGRPR